MIRSEFVSSRRALRMSVRIVTFVLPALDGVFGEMFGTPTEKQG